MGILYTGMKIFHFNDKLRSLSKETDNIMAPVNVRIKPTNRCCHNCRYCIYRNGNRRLYRKEGMKNVHISREKMMEILDDIIDMGVEAVTFTGGGEPFVYPYFIEAIKRLSASPVKFAALTNGSLLRDEAAEIFASRATWLRVSMDGWDDESYSSYRGVPPGEFTRIMENMRDFKKLGGDCYLGVSLIVDKKNAFHVYEMLKRLKCAGVDSAKIAACLVDSRAQENNTYHREIMDEVGGQISRARQDLESSGFEIFDAYNTLDEVFEKDYHWCPYIQILPVIGADLYVYACPDKAYDREAGSIGSIEGRRFKQFWFADKSKFFMIDPSVRCDHHCERNQKNKLVLDYLNADKKHLSFV